MFEFPHFQFTALHRYSNKKVSTEFRANWVKKRVKKDKSCLINCKNQNLRWCLCLKTGTCILNAEKVIATEIGTGELGRKGAAAAAASAKIG